jgi:hypothetical protein
MIALLPLKLKLTVIGIMAVAASFSAWLWNHDRKVAKKVTTTIVERSKAQGSAANAKAATIYNSTKRGSAVERLRNDKLACPDCR